MNRIFFDGHLMFLLSKQILKSGRYQNERESDTQVVRCLDEFVENQENLSKISYEYDYGDWTQEEYEYGFDEDVIHMNINCLLDVACLNEYVNT